MSDGVKKDNLQQMENGLNEVARYIDRKIYEIETRWPCEMHESDMPAGDETPEQVFNHLNSKYPGKHWLVLTYNDVTGYDHHNYYNRIDLCESGNSNVGRYHGVQAGLVWVAARSPRAGRHRPAPHAAH